MFVKFLPNKQFRTVKKKRHQGGRTRTQQEKQQQGRSQLCLQLALNINDSLLVVIISSSWVCHVSTGVLIRCLPLTYRLCGEDCQPPGYQTLSIHSSKCHRPQSVMANPSLHQDGSHHELSFLSLITQFLNP